MAHKSHCLKCNALLNYYYLKDGVCNGCRHPESIVVSIPASPEERCFACDRKLGKHPKLVATRESGQSNVYVGSECYRQIRKTTDKGWQPPKGGPRLYDDFKQ